MSRRLFLLLGAPALTLFVMVLSGATAQTAPLELPASHPAIVPSGTAASSGAFSPAALRVVPNAAAHVRVGASVSGSGTIDHAALLAAAARELPAVRTASFRPAAQAGGNRARAAAPAQGAPADYAGEQTCLSCHEDRAYKGTKHALAFNPRTPSATHGCESCHGPGKAHAESGDAALIRNPKTMKPQEASAICASCHNRGTHLLWDGSQHDQRNVGCVTCHSVHNPKAEPQLVAKTETEVCATCHKPVVNRQHRFSHMPVREGQMKCSSCHNPHGSTNVRLLKAGTTVDESCTSCHADKRGPYLWEHAPVTESCTTCHEPHGSNNDRMLVSKVPFLCQRCHVTSRHPPTVYEGNLLQNSTNGNKISARGCLNCHTMIHGSNAPSGKSLLR